MAWGKVDDKLHASVKWRRATKGARALWTTALSWCSDQENDGEIPKDMLRVLDGTPNEAKSLVNAGLWNEKTEGWEFHNWSKYNPDAATRKAKRDAESEGGKRGNHARWHQKQGLRVPGCEYCYPVEPESGAHRVPDQGGESGANPPGPARPVPSQSTSNEVDKARSTKLSKNWVPTKSHYDRAAELNLDITEQAERFRLHAETHDRRAANWNAAFTTWLKKSVDYQPANRYRNQGNYTRPQRPNRVQQNMEVVRELAARNQQPQPPQPEWKEIER